MSQELTTEFTDYLDRLVTAVQTGIALFLAILLVIGVVNLVATFVQAALTFELLGYKNAIALISTTVDIVLYLFIVIELFRTVVAYVEAESVVRAVIHAGLIAVVRQIITFKPAETDGSEDALMLSAVYVILLVGLLLGFYLVHKIEAEEGVVDH